MVSIVDNSVLSKYNIFPPEWKFEDQIRNNVKNIKLIDIKNNEHKTLRIPNYLFCFLKHYSNINSKYSRNKIDNQCEKNEEAPYLFHIDGKVFYGYEISLFVFLIEEDIELKYFNKEHKEANLSKNNMTNTLYNLNVNNHIKYKEDNNGEILKSCFERTNCSYIFQKNNNTNNNAIYFDKIKKYENNDANENYPELVNLCNMKYDSFLSFLFKNSNFQKNNESNSGCYYIEQFNAYLCTILDPVNEKVILSIYPINKWGLNESINKALNFIQYEDYIKKIIEKIKYDVINVKSNLDKMEINNLINAFSIYKDSNTSNHNKNNLFYGKEINTSLEHNTMHNMKSNVFCNTVCHSIYPFKYTSLKKHIRSYTSLYTNKNLKKGIKRILSSMICLFEKGRKLKTISNVRKSNNPIRKYRNAINISTKMERSRSNSVLKSADMYGNKNDSLIIDSLSIKKMNQCVEDYIVFTLHKFNVKNNLRFRGNAINIIKRRLNNYLIRMYLGFNNNSSANKKCNYESDFFETFFLRTILCLEDIRNNVNSGNWKNCSSKMLENKFDQINDVFDSKEKGYKFEEGSYRVKQCGENSEYHEGSNNGTNSEQNSDGNSERNSERNSGSNNSGNSGGHHDDNSGDNGSSRDSNNDGSNDDDNGSNNNNNDDDDDDENEENEENDDTNNDETRDHDYSNENEGYSSTNENNIIKDKFKYVDNFDCENIDSKKILNGEMPNFNKYPFNGNKSEISTNYFENSCNISANNSNNGYYEENHHMFLNSDEGLTITSVNMPNVKSNSRDEEITFGNLTNENCHSDNGYNNMNTYVETYLDNNKAHNTSDAKRDSYSTNEERISNNSLDDNNKMKSDIYNENDLMFHGNNINIKNELINGDESYESNLLRMKGNLLNINNKDSDTCVKKKIIKKRNKTKLERSSKSLDEEKKEVLNKVSQITRVGGVCFDKNRQRWIAHWKIDGKYHKHYFPISQYGFENARERAINCRKQAEKLFNLPEIQPRNRWNQVKVNGTSHIKKASKLPRCEGVAYDEMSQSWVSTFVVHKKFSIDELGFYEARDRAIYCRRAFEKINSEEDYEFLLKQRLGLTEEEKEELSALFDFDKNALEKMDAVGNTVNGNKIKSNMHNMKIQDNADYSPMDNHNNMEQAKTTNNNNNMESKISNEQYLKITQEAIEMILSNIKHKSLPEIKHKLIDVEKFENYNTLIDKHFKFVTSVTNISQLQPYISLFHKFIIYHTLPHNVSLKKQLCIIEALEWSSFFSGEVNHKID
ncbi:transcription factor with AP2 domain(s), putative [Plasmodium chabaudi chabaudi]|uniref:Transcription factor with AP2 domain(S), putative n=1 Tax=Plasmodium chabaudi chabaudi TaxID=31271 RepID=A0A1D3LAW0_PLACU|nr:transcription factor with AP2 domain(s), putative [Plasmodium chabaudi chabaudi]